MRAFDDEVAPLYDMGILLGRRMIGYETAEEIAADCLFEAQGDVAEAQRLARRHIIGEDDYQHVAKLIEAAAERVTIPTDKQSPFA